MNQYLNSPALIIKSSHSYTERIRQEIQIAFQPECYQRKQRRTSTFEMNEMRCGGCWKYLKLHAGEIFTEAGSSNSIITGG